MARRHLSPRLGDDRHGDRRCGLIDLGIAGGDRVCILCNTRPEWTYCDFAHQPAPAPSSSRSTRRTRPRSASGSPATRRPSRSSAEDAEQVAKIVEVRDQLPAPAPRSSSMDGAARAATRSRSTSCASAAAAATPPSSRRAWTRSAPEDPYTFIYTSGTTGPPKGCVLDARQLPRDARHGHASRRAARRRRGDVIYLFLPLAHAFALLIQLLAVDLGAHDRLLRRRHAADHPRARAGQADLPAVGPAHLREALHARPDAAAEPEEIDQRSARSAAGSSDLEVAGQDGPGRAARPLRPGRRRRSPSSRSLFGGRLRQAVTGAAPIAPEILEFFWACGVPVLEGYGMTETATAATDSTLEEHKFGTVGARAARLRGPDRRRRRDPHQGREHLRRLLQERRRVVRRGRSTAGCTPATSARIDEDGYLSITGRKKDIIITAGGKNLTPANIENDLKQIALDLARRSCTATGGRSRSMLITLDEEEIVPWAQARRHRGHLDRGAGARTRRCSS